MHPEQLRIALGQPRIVTPFAERMCMLVDVKIVGVQESKGPNDIHLLCTQDQCSPCGSVSAICTRIPYP